MNPLTLILGSVILGVFGQLALKAAMSSLGPMAVGGSARGSIARIATTPGVWVGLAIYGLGTFLWLIALSQVDLGYAYPFLSLSYVLILVASWLLFREAMSWWRLGGVAAICVGVYIAAGGNL
jgi:drug/metabolite transporter (DMT)-like permease